MTKLTENMAITENMVAMSQDLSFMAKDFQKDSATLEEIMVKQSFWACSKKCLMIFGSAGCCLLILIIWW